MIEFQSKEPEPTSVDLTPLIDVVFQLLVFFLLTSAFISTGITVELPDAETGESGDDTTLAISIDAEGAIFVGPDEVTLETLDERLALEVEQGIVARVAVYGDVSVRYGLFMEILDRCRRNGLMDVVLMVRPAPAAPP